MTNETTRRIAKTALMVALIFVCTFTIKLPNPELEDIHIWEIVWHFLLYFI
ncbi:hypothetical protein [Holdemanella biformis]|uniref:hypothetical protein n=1 Tax=Holdemanella biformis TaxID=1735 RepID=UPI00319D8CD1